jgi:hypothetical protein
VPKYRLLVDGQRKARLGSEQEVRDWLAAYCAKHAEDDPQAAHVQIIETGSLWFITGGKLVPRERFL